MDCRTAATLAVGLGASLWGLVTGVRIQDFLRRRGRKVNLLRLRWIMFTYIGKYRRIRQRELGRSGLLYSHFKTSWLIALAAAVFGVVPVRSG